MYMRIGIDIVYGIGFDIDSDTGIDIIIGVHVDID